MAAQLGGDVTIVDRDGLGGAAVLLLLIPVAAPLAPLAALALVTAVAVLLVAAESTRYAEVRAAIRAHH